MEIHFYFNNYRGLLPNSPSSCKTVCHEPDKYFFESPIGFGQSIQKFNVLPEPIGDSIFAVASEEFGFLGAVFIVLLFVFFSFRGLKIATQISDPFGRLVVVGIVILIVSQAFVNIGAMVGVLPLSGITLPFVSHGGTALFMTLAEVGIILNISKNRKKN